MLREIRTMEESKLEAMNETPSCAFSKESASLPQIDHSLSKARIYLIYINISQRIL